MSAPLADDLTVVTGASQNYINVHPTRGAALAKFLRSRGVTCSPPQPCSDGVDSIEVARAVDVQFVQKLLKGWKPSVEVKDLRRATEC